MTKDWNLEALLLMNGEVHEAGDGLWWKMEAGKVDPTPARPHGIRYCLTLHDRDNKRIFGIDTAHGLTKRSRSPGAKRRVEFDHQHEGRKVKDYEYQDRAGLNAGLFRRGGEREKGEKGKIKCLSRKK